MSYKNIRKSIVATIISQLRGKGEIMGSIINISAEYIKKFALSNGTDFVGIASIDRFDGSPEGHHPKDLLKTVRSVIVCGIIVPTGALFAPSTLYHKVIEATHLELDQIAMKVSWEIEKNGGLAVPIPSHAPYYFWDEENQYAMGDLSIRHAAEAAGLGKISKSAIFISKDYGILTRMACVLTDIEIEPDPIADWNPCPEECKLCVSACPVNALQTEKQCTQSICRKNLFSFTLGGVKVEDCRECIKACPWVLKRKGNKVNQECVRTFNIGSIENQSNTPKKVIISTLGPAGTCSEQASLFYINKNNYAGEVVLYSSFEEAVLALKESKSDYVIIPSAYQNIASIIFQEKCHIEIHDVFKLATPSLVIAGKGKDKEVKKIATHASPSSLAKEYYPNAELIISKSNSNSAEMLIANEVDACITTMNCAIKYSLDIIHDFGAIAMGWNVLKRKS